MTLAPGDMLNNRWQVEEVIRPGSHAVNYRGKEAATGRPVFIKEFLPSAYAAGSQSKKETLHGFTNLTPERASQVIQGECRIRLTYHHECLPQALDFFAAGDKLYFVSEWIEGKDLPALIKANKRKPLPPRRLVEWMIPILDALEYMHQYHFVHRDVKPDNILIDPAGKPFLVDEGSARVVTGSIKKGSPIFYCAPEFLLHPAQAGPAADIYSAGASLYFALSAQQPPNPLELAAGSTTFEPADLQPDLPAGLIDALKKAMAVQPGERFSSAAAFKEQLISLLPSLPEAPAEIPPVKATPVEPPSVEPQAEEKVVPPAEGDQTRPEIPEQEEPEDTISTEEQPALKEKAGKTNAKKTSAKKAALPKAEDQPPAPKKKSSLKWLPIVLVVVVIAAVIISVIAVNNARQNNAELETRLAVQQTAAAISLTQTAQFAIASQTAAAASARQAATAAALSATQQFVSTATARAYATLQAMTKFTGDDMNLAAQARLLSGPESGQINIAIDAKPDVYCLPYTVRNFIVSAKFTNPNSPSEGYWDYGFILRQDAAYSYRLIFNWDRNYQLEFWKSYLMDTAYGTKAIGNFDNNYPAVNLVTLIVQNDTVRIYVNSEYTASMNVSKQNVAGQVCLAAALFSSHEHKNTKVGYADLYLWELP